MLYNRIKERCKAAREARRNGLNLRADQSGLALIEFAFVAPFLLLVGLMGLEIVNFILAHQKASQISVLVADNAARKLEQMDEQDVSEIFYGAHVTGEAVDIGENGRIILHMLTDNGRVGNQNGTWVRWQRCYGELGEDDNLQSEYGVEGDGADDNSLADGVGPDGEKVRAYLGAPVNYVEVILDYEPLVGNGIVEPIFGDIQINYTAALLVRERTVQDIVNQSSLPANSLWTCNRYASFDT